MPNEWDEFPLVNASDIKLPDSIGYNQLGDAMGWDSAADWANNKDQESKQGNNMLTDAAPYPRSQGTQDFWGSALLFDRMPTSGDKPWKKPATQGPSGVQHMNNADRSISHVPPYNDKESPSGAGLTNPWLEDTDPGSVFYGNTET
jgi:hypothetical protein